ncbi:MAG: RNA 3'-terminal phosphate cyclase [Candidatus Aenigmatarchaeota archaeon]
MIVIPGEYGSGSGTIVRLATAFSALTGKPIKITDIRAKRPNPGLRHQHLETLRAIAKLSGAKLKGDEVGSKEIEFTPKKIKSGTIDVAIETAGSIGLLTYAVMIPAICASGKTILRIKGGSTASLWAPPVYYMENVLLPTLAKMGIEAKFTINKHGFFPKGGADVVFEISPAKKIAPIVMKDAGDVETITGLSIASNDLKSRNVAERQIAGYRRIIRKEKGVEIKPSYVSAASTGSAFVVWARTTTGCILSGDHVGEEKKPAEVAGEEAAFKLKEEIDYGSTVGFQLADQLIPFMALACGKSEILVPELTEHVKTNIWLCEKFLGSKFVTKENGEHFRVSCSGRASK